MTDRDMEDRLRKVELLQPPSQAKREVLQQAERRSTINRRLRLAVVTLAAAAALLLIVNFVADDFIQARIDALTPESISAAECARALKARQQLILETLEFNVNGDHAPTESADRDHRSSQNPPPTDPAASEQTAPDRPPEGNISTQPGVD